MYTLLFWTCLISNYYYLRPAENPFTFPNRGLKLIFTRGEFLLRPSTCLPITVRSGFLHLFISSAEGRSRAVLSARPPPPPPPPPPPLAVRIRIENEGPKLESVFFSALESLAVN